MKQNIIILIVLLTCNFAFGQDHNPVELVKLVFSDTLFVDQISNYSTGEYEGRPNSLDIESGTRIKFKVLEENLKTSVINITFTDSLGKGFDTYVHLRKEQIWKICAFRSLAMTGMLEVAKLEFENMSEEQVDALIAKGDMNIKSREDFQREYRKIKLTLALDENIIDHFNSNKTKFNKIVKELSEVKLNESDLEMRKFSMTKYIDSNFKNLLVSNISTSFYCENCYEFTIGGIVDNIVGYLYIPNQKDVPKMNPNRLIMIREIGNGWYLFKTT